MERIDVASGPLGVWRLSWVAYVAPLVKYGILIAIVSAFEFIPWWVTTMLLTRLVYVLIYLRTVKVILNENGVWKHFGLLPWSRGAVGVKWRDLDQAEIYFGFFPWLTNSHTVRVGHRFTKASELLVPNVADGKGLIEVINREHDDRARSGALS